MAGLVGMISHDRARPIPPGEAAALIATFQQLRGAGHVEQLACGTWASVARIDGLVPGRLDRSDASWTLSAGAIHGDGDLATVTPERLDGQFAAIRYDARADSLAVVADPFGMQTLYVAERDGRTYVSTCATTLARHLRAAPDPLGLALFIRAGYLFGPVTHWEGVRRLDPAEEINFAPGGQTRRTYWLPAVDASVRAMSYAETVAHCTTVLLDVLGRRVGDAGPLWADLTGGFDSRLLTSALRTLGLPVRTATVGGETDPDVVLAQRVAQAGGLDWVHEALPAGWSPSPALLATALAWGDGSLEVLQLSDVLWHSERRASSSRIVVSGGGGEHVSARPWVQEFLRAGRSRQVNYDNLLRMRYLPPVDLSVVRDDPGPAAERYCRTQLARRAEAYPGELNTTQLDAIYAYKSTGHFGAYRSATQAFVQQEIPFYYRDLYEACFSAHHRWRNGHRLQRGMIERLGAAAAAVPTTLGGPAQRKRIANAHRFIPYYRDAAKAALGKLGIARPARRVRTVATPADARAAGLEVLLAGGTLDPAAMRSRDLYDERRLTALLAGAREPGFGHWSVIGRIVTVELLLRAARPE